MRLPLYCAVFSSTAGSDVFVWAFPSYISFDVDGLVILRVTTPFLQPAVT